jgi:hypothetical protein
MSRSVGLEEDNVKTTNLLLAAIVAVSASGCSEEMDTDDGGDDGVLPSELCPDRRQICAGDTICTGTQCEDAFDRDYVVRMSLTFPGGKVDPCPDGFCRYPAVKVYYSELDSPILSGSDRWTAKIHAIEGSSLIVEVNDDACTIDVTAERLRRGIGTCAAGGVGVALTLDLAPPVG